MSLIWWNYSYCRQHYIPFRCILLLFQILQWVHMYQRCLRCLRGHQWICPALLLLPAPLSLLPSPGLFTLGTYTLRYGMRKMAQNPSCPVWPSPLPEVTMGEKSPAWLPTSDRTRAPWQQTALCRYSESCVRTTFLVSLMTAWLMLVFIKRLRSIQMN